MKSKTHKLSIYLIKKEVVDFESSLKSSFVDYSKHELKQSFECEGLIIVGRTREKTSDWRGLLQEGTDSVLADLSNASNRAVLFFKIEGRIFAIAFGFGKHLLNEELIEREFGLRTALNLVDFNKFISIDKANLSEVTVLTRTQSSVKAKPDSFNLDVVSDLLKGVTGGLIVGNSDLGNIITGNDGVSILPKINFKDFPEVLKKINTAHLSERYKENFDWVDNLKELKDPRIINVLKDELISKLKAKDSNHIHIAPPNIIDWENFEGYAFNGARDELKTDFDIEDFYNYKDDKINEIDWISLLSQKIYIKFSNVDYRYSSALTKYLNFETTLGNQVYVFSLGKWYQVNLNYIQEIKDFVKDVEESDVDFMDYDRFEKLSEGDYNLAFAGTSLDLVSFDKELIKSDYMSRSNIELCDVMCLSKKELIHVKFRYNSATLSHLFAQGRISSYVLIKDRSFRMNCRKKLSTMDLDLNLIPSDGFKPGDYTITFALIDKKDRTFVEALPFFSLINFRLTLQELRLYGFNVKVKNIKGV